MSASSKFLLYSGITLEKKPQGLQIFQNVTGLGGDEEHEETVKGLIDISDTVSLHEGVLFAGSHQLREGSQQALDP